MKIVVRITPQGVPSLFFQGGAGLGLTAALGMVRRGLVFVGNLPTTDGTSNTARAGSILVLDRFGRLLGALSDPNMIDGPWGMTVVDLGGEAILFFSNVLNGTVTRIVLSFSDDGESAAVRSSVTIGSGFQHRPDPAALELGPSGVAFDAAHDILYVADSADNTIYAIASAANRATSAGTGSVVYSDPVHLHGPLDLSFAPNGDLVVANSDGSNADPNQPSELVEFTIQGKFVAQFSVDPNNGGAFGLAIQRLGNAAVRAAAVDDNTNKLTIWTFPL
jgi:DNA-binding beta-propeller fold protein YncE